MDFNFVPQFFRLPDVRTDSFWSEGAYNVAVHTEGKAQIKFEFAKLQLLIYYVDIYELHSERQ